MLWRSLGTAILLGGVLLTSLAQADESMQERTLQTPDGIQHFAIHKSVNSNGELEVQIAHEEFRALVPGHTSNIVLYGRDLDRSGRINAWFFPGEDGVLEAVDRPADLSKNPDDDAWNAASVIILNTCQYHDRWLIGILAHATASAMTLTESSEDRFERKLVEEELDLRDLEVRVNRLDKSSPRDPNLLALYETLSDGWANLSQQISTEGIRDRFLYAAGDVALYAATAGIAEGAGKVGVWALPKVMTSAPGVWALDLYTRFAGGVAEAASHLSQRVSERGAQLGIDAENLARLKQAVRWPLVEGAVQTVRETIEQRVSMLVRGLSSRAQVATIFARSAEALKAVAKGALVQWKYIASTQALELGVEIYERRDTLFSPNPYVFARRIVTDKDLIEDVSFMTWDSTLSAGISVADPNLKRRMVVCGVLSLVNSTGMNMLVKKEPDKTRTGIDTSWEMVVGNIETQLDLKALNYFETMAEKSANPKLKLLGYAVAFIDDGVGYWAYEKVTNRYERVKAKDAAVGKTVGTFEWIPLFGER